VEPSPQAELHGDPSRVRPEVRAILAELRRRFEAIYGDRLVAMVLYGSQARGDSEDGSDIDVLVVLRGEVDPSAEIDRTLDDVAEPSLGNNVVVSCVFTEEERYLHRFGPLLPNIRREGVPA
jgi:predicted nucleotidyltransferase